MEHGPDRRLDGPAGLPSIAEARQVDELRRILAARPQLFRLQFLGVATGPGPMILDETEIQAADASAAIRSAAESPWPPRAVCLRVVDREGREVFEQLRSDRR